MFRIKYKNDEYIYREYYKYCLFRRPKVFAFWVILLGTYFMSLAAKKGSVETLSFFPVFMFMQVYIYQSKVRLAYKKACNLDGEAYTYELTADDEKIAFTSDEGISYDVEYGRISSYALYDGMIFLFTHSKKFFILPEDKFAEGKSSDFIFLLDEKGVKAENVRK